MTQSINDPVNGWMSQYQSNKKSTNQITLKGNIYVSNIPTTG